MFPEVTQYLTRNLWQPRVDVEPSVSDIDKQGSITRASVAAKLYARGLPTRRSPDSVGEMRRSLPVLAAKSDVFVRPRQQISGEFLRPRDLFADMAKMSELIPRMSGLGPRPNIFAFCTPIATNALNIFQCVS